MKSDMREASVKSSPLFKLMLLFVVALGGCSSSSYGTKLDQSQLDKIQKGVTTRSQVEAMFGAPASLTISPDGSGRRTATWQYTEANAHAKATSFIPVYGMFAGGAEGKSQTQSLQVIYNKSEVVEDYAFSGGSSNSDMTATPWGTNMHTDTAATQPAASD